MENDSTRQTAIQELNQRLGAELLIAVAHVVSRTDAIMAAVAMMHDAIEGLTRDANPDDVRRRAAALEAGSARIQCLLLDVGQEIGSLKMAALTRSLLAEEGGAA